MYLDPNLGVPLLEPLFRLQAHPNYATAYAADDLGACALLISPRVVY